MGCYLNPAKESKEDFLRREGIAATLEEACAAVMYPITPMSLVPVVLVDNGNFTAAGICYNGKEFARWIDTATSPDDMRPMQFFFVEAQKMFPHSDLESFMKEKR